MKLFIDTADVGEVKKYKWMIDGVTTNPKLIAKTGCNTRKIAYDITSVFPLKPVSIAVLQEDTEGMERDAEAYSQIAENIIIKVPATEDGFKVIPLLKKKGIRVNLTIVYTVSQAILAAKLGADYVSPFLAKADDLFDKGDGQHLIEDIAKIYRRYNYNTEIIAASIRELQYLRMSALAGAHIATVPPNVLDMIMNNDTTNTSLQEFLDAIKG